MNCKYYRTRTKKYVSYKEIIPKKRWLQYWNL